MATVVAETLTQCFPSGERGAYPPIVHNRQKNREEFSEANREIHKIFIQKSKSIWYNGCGMRNFYIIVA
jgi:hypothetical protein